VLKRMVLKMVWGEVGRLENATKKRRGFRSFRPRWDLVHMQCAYSWSSTSSPTYSQFRNIFFPISSQKNTSILSFPFFQKNRTLQSIIVLHRALIILLGFAYWFNDSRAETIQLRNIPLFFGSINADESRIRELRIEETLVVVSTTTVLASFYPLLEFTSHPAFTWNEELAKVIALNNFNQAQMANRFLEIVGIPETMIFDTLDLPTVIGQPTRTVSIERPFFTVIDSELLSEMNVWSWESGNYGYFEVWADSVVILGSSVGYNIPSQSLSGTFNQAEQRFYVSDGRQYQVVPEPSALSLLAIGLGGLATMRRRCRS